MTDNGKKILVVDDEEVIRKIISFNLQRRGFTPVLADSAFAALDLLGNNEVRLVLCDVNMAGMDGFTFCSKVREREEYKALPFIFITAKDSPETRNQAFTIGADDYVTKPFNIEALMLKIEALLKRVEIYRAYGIREKATESVSEIRKRLLVVDDDPFFAGMIKASFANAGYEVREALSAETGLDFAHSFSPDIILSDILMPGTDGYQFRQSLLDDPRLREIPFVFLTSADTDQMIIDGFNYNIKDYIVKTTRPQVLVAKISNIINTTRRERQKGIRELKEAAGNVGIDVAPNDSPAFKGFSIQQWFVTYQDIPGGDFIDYIELGENKLAIVLGDVMGKKWGAWFFAFSFIGYLRSTIRSAVEGKALFSAADILQEANKAIYKDAKISEIFSSVSVVILDNQKKSFQYAGAGDLPLLLIKNEGRQVIKIASDDPLLGMKPAAEYQAHEYSMDAGDHLLLFSDGLTDSRNSNGQALTFPGLTDLLRQGNYDEPFAFLKERFSVYTGGRFDDDISLICVEAI